MTEEEMLQKLALEEYPKGQAKERLRMILALTKYIRSGLDEKTLPPSPSANALPGAAGTSSQRT